ncbi:MAG: ATP-binding protein [Pseudomonadota bacterium]
MANIERSDAELDLPSTQGIARDEGQESHAVGAKSGATRQWLSSLLAPLAWLQRLIGKLIKPILPRGLYARSLMIIIAPVVLLQSVAAFVFLERHWELVTERLSEAVTRDIAAVIAMVETYADDDEAQADIFRIARETLDLNVAVLPETSLPDALPRPFFDLLNRTLSQKIAQRIDRPYWVDTVGRSNLIEVRVQLDDGQTLRVFARRSNAYASNSHIFLVWMTGASLVLLIVAILFLRNQIRPILELAGAADRFGQGQAVDRPIRLRGAREVRSATLAFWRMQERIERHVDQRTAMLSGVSHDLRTILTRFKLELALLSDQEAARSLTRDVDDMQAMLEGYLAFAKGDDGENSIPTDVEALLHDVASQVGTADGPIAVSFEGDAETSVKPNAFKRLITNLIMNALRHAEHVTVRATRSADLLTIDIDDNGPGIPAHKREEVFRPFYRLDEARNLDDSGTGLGLPIARDIARAHGGDITLDESAMGGLRARVTLPG